MDGQDGVHARRHVAAVHKPGRSTSGAMVQMAAGDAHLLQRAGHATLVLAVAITQPQASTLTEEVITSTSIGIP